MASAGRDRNPRSSAEAEVIALKALGFLASDGDRMQRFMDLTGLAPDAVRVGAGDPAFLGGILDHLLADETLLLTFCEDHDVKPERIAAMRASLPGGAIDF